LSRTTVDSNFFHGPIEFEITRVNCTYTTVMYKYVVGLSARDGTMYFYVPNMVFGTSWF
jgi:hypothetical protein